MFLYREDIEKVYRESVSRNSDQGTCVMGYTLRMNGIQVVPQPFQGSSGCYNVYEDVKRFMIDELGYGEHTISVDYGVMD
jgi:hypothetical protein